jgi:hypothetical protein
MLKLRLGALQMNFEINGNKLFKGVSFEGISVCPRDLSVKRPMGSSRQ